MSKKLTRKQIDKEIKRFDEVDDPERNLRIASFIKEYPEQVSGSILIIKSEGKHMTYVHMDANHAEETIQFLRHTADILEREISKHNVIPDYTVPVGYG
jgi:hypothetical protein